MDRPTHSSVVFLKSIFKDQNTYFCCERKQILECMGEEICISKQDIWLTFSQNLVKTWVIIQVSCEPCRVICINYINVYFIELSEKRDAKYNKVLVSLASHLIWPMEAVMCLLAGLPIMPLEDEHFEVFNLGKVFKITLYAVLRGQGSL